ncbi:MAG: hypothetical protein ABSD61_01845 [Terracidiphilus sp.]|jgi:chromosome segregation ATPase
MSDSEAAVETQNEEQQAREEPVALAVSMDDFSALEERVRRAVEMVKRERQARAAAEARVAELETHATESEARAAQAEARQAELEARAAQAEERAKAQLPVVEQLKSELSALRAERDQVRERVERLLKQLDTLEL